VEGSVRTLLTPSEIWNPGGALSAAPQTEIPQFACSELPKAVTESRSSAGENGVIGEFGLAVTVEGSVRTLLPPSEWWIPVGALCVAPRTGISKFASSAPVGAITEPRDSAGENGLIG
jgi:hypothetical protein